MIYACSRHGTILEKRIRLVPARKGIKQVEYWACPIKGCNYVKPEKRQARRKRV